MGGPGTCCLWRCRWGGLGRYGWWRRRRELSLWHQASCIITGRTVLRRPTVEVPEFPRLSLPSPPLLPSSSPLLFFISSQFLLLLLLCHLFLCLPSISPHPASTSGCSASGGVPLFQLEGDGDGTPAAVCCVFDLDARAWLTLLAAHC